MRHIRASSVFRSFVARQRDMASVGSIPVDSPPFVFVGYAQQDRDKARQVVGALRTAQIQTWWDQDIPPTEMWRREIERRLKEARCVIVLWTEHSVADDSFCRDEAAEAGPKLLSVLIGVDRPPFGFRERQWRDLRTARLSPDDAAFSGLLNDVRTLLGSPARGRAGLDEPDPIPTRNPTVDDLQVQPVKPISVVKTQPSDGPSPSKSPSYFKATLAHLLFGTGMFTADPKARRKWLYPLIVAAFWLAVFLSNDPNGPFVRTFWYPQAGVRGGMVPVRRFDPSAFFAVIAPVLSLFAISLLDVLRACRRRRRDQSVTNR
jgi:hypothetical protein